jgi:hypothetical protein
MRPKKSREKVKNVYSGRTDAHEIKNQQIYKISFLKFVDNF